MFQQHYFFAYQFSFLYSNDCKFKVFFVPNVTDVHKSFRSVEKNIQNNTKVL